MENAPEHVSCGTAKLIGFFFGFRMMIYVIGVRWFGFEPQTGIAITLVLNIACLLLAATAPSRHRGTQAIGRLPTVRWAFVYLAFSGLSLLWTVAASRAAAVAYWCAMAADAGAVVFLLRRRNVRDSSISLMQGFVYGACFLAAIAWTLPAQSDLRLGDEELLGPNQIGYAAAFAMFFALFLIRERIGNNKPAFVFLALTLLRSLSKTSILAFLAAAGWLLVRDRSLSLKTKAWLSVAAIGLVMVSSGLLLAYIEVYLNLGNQSVTLSGRVTLWAYILNEAIDKPWIGHGFHSVWKVIPPLNGDFEARHAHNEWLQQFYAYGVVGVVMLIGIYGSFLRQVRGLRRSPLSALLMSLMVFVLVRGAADTEVFDLSLPMWSVILWSVLMRATQPAMAAPAVSAAPLLSLQEVIVTPL